MNIIFGGAYQGKLEYVREQFHIENEEIFYCDETQKNPMIDFSKRVIYNLENFTLACTLQGMEAKTYFEQHREELEDKIVICADISQGIVPMDKDMRMWREMNGRAMIYLSNEADSVTRIFCGLPQEIKKSENTGIKKQESYIHLIRHGTTEGNVKRWYYGRADIPLTEDGKALIAELAEQSIYPRVTEGEFYTSGLLRTEQTFGIIFGDRKHQALENFMEMSFGDYEKLSYEDLKDNPEYQTWIGDKTGTLAPPGGESPKAFQKRVSKGFKEVMDRHRLRELSTRHAGKSAESVVVCHGGVISAVMAEQFPKEKKHFFEWIPEPGHGYTIQIDGGTPNKFTKF